MTAIAMDKVQQKHPNYDFHQDIKHIADLPVSDFIPSQFCGFIADTLVQIPRGFRRDVLDHYETLYRGNSQDEAINAGEAKRAANGYLLGLSKSMDELGFVSQSDEGLRKKAQRLARYSAAQMHKGGIDAGLKVLSIYQIDVPFADSNESLMQRLKDDAWWLRQLTKKYDRQFEQTAIRLGRVCKHKQVYVSNETLNKVLARHKRSLEIMGKMQAVSDEGDTVEMLDILKASSANPAIRRVELMNRLYGFEQYADAQGHCAEFYTLTAPSKYHANSAKFNGWTPKQVQANYFSKIWARIRAKLKYYGLNVYGFRIAEPHADACPHWHLLLFMPKDCAKQVGAILKDYALREDAEEKGAAKNRFDVEHIDPSKGSAVGYIAKYISKNIDGFGMEAEPSDESDAPVSESAQRVRAWASVWGIRQFQQIGGSSITVWRELRRLEDELPNKLLEIARKAADSGDWCAYLEAQGGTDTLRKDQPIKPHYIPRYDPETGTVQVNKYGELVDYIKGIMLMSEVDDIAIETRLKQWVIQNKPEEEEQDAAVAMASALALDVALDLPWSSVNNCRITEKEYEEFSGFSSPRRE